MKQKLSKKDVLKAAIQLAALELTDLSNEFTFENTGEGILKIKGGKEIGDTTNFYTRDPLHNYSDKHTLIV